MINRDNVMPRQQKTVQFQQLGKVVATSRKMLEYAQADDWNSLVLLEKERSHLLSEFFQKPANESESNDIASAILLIQSLDKKTMEYVKSEHKTVSEELKKLNKGRRVNKAYLQ